MVAHLAFPTKVVQHAILAILNIALVVLLGDVGHTKPTYIYIPLGAHFTANGQGRVCPCNKVDQFLTIGNVFFKGP